MRAYVLCGGFGTRLRSVTDTQKALVPVHGEPFLARVLRQLARAGISEAVLCAHYRAEQVAEQLAALAHDAGLRLTATDMEIAVVEEIPGVTVARPGRTTAPAATLYEMVRNLPEGAKIELDHPGGDAPLALRAGRFATSLMVLPVEDFPSMTDGKLPHRFTLPAGVLRDLIDRTRFAISTEETRYYLNGIYLHAGEVDGAPVLRAVATDGHRLARVEEPLPEGAKGMPGVIVPRKTVGELQRLIETSDAEIGVDGTDLSIGQPEADRLLAGSSQLRASVRRDETGTVLRSLDLTADGLRRAAE